VTYYRVFKTSKSKNGKQLWNRHGRWYCSLTNIKRDLRKHLLVNGESTCEIDYKAHHMQILYTYEKLKTPFDCYSLSSTTTVPRGLIKKISMCLLNNAELVTAKQAITASEEYREFSKHIRLDDIINEYVAIHEPIAKYFLKGMGNELMWVDSQIAEYVFVKLSDQQIPCLAIHDSFVVPVTHKAQLEKLMVEAYQQVLSTKLLPAYTTKH